ncbi:hypothetical protein DSO57_1026418 [Entomophthora muscae]|uniref:Uncharacterized protein n=1 Tax=Entomophthora muscae TaxID=34485 RepID=A0ACC2RGT8_9FUNG|nr:hypothetical protein DSO57_1026418 [Entomophthora muscae]
MKPWTLVGSLYVRNITDTYSCVINKLSSAANVKAPATTKQTSTVNMQTSTTNVQTSAAIKQIHTTTTQKPATTKMLPTANTQTLDAIKQMPLPLHRRPSLLPASPASHPQTRHPWASLPPARYLPTFALTYQQASPHPLLWEIARSGNQERQFPQSQTWKELLPNLGAYQMGNGLTGYPTMEIMHQIQ